MEDRINYLEGYAFAAHSPNWYPVLAYYLDNREAVDGYIAQREDKARKLRKSIEHDFDPTGLRARLLARRAGEH